MVLVLIKGKKVVLGNGNIMAPGFVCVSQKTGLITSITSSSPFKDAEKSIHLMEADVVCPGFVDIHNHGFSEETEDDNLKVHGYNTKTLPRYGTTSILATLTFPNDIKKAYHLVDAVEKIAGKVLEDRSVVEGIYAEGPWVSDYGTHVYSNEDFDMDVFTDMITRMRSCRMLALSPSAEAQCNHQRLCHALEKGIVPALGHDRRATEEHIIATLLHYTKNDTNPHSLRPHITHLFNVSSFNHRLPSLVNFGLVRQFPNSDEYAGLSVPTVDMVMDMEHVAAITVSAVLAARDHNDVAAITDAVMDYEMEIGTTRDIKNGTVEMIKRDGGGKVVAQKGTKTLAGSCTNQLRILHSLVFKLHMPIEKAVSILSSTPAMIARLDHKLGLLEEGRRADILLLNEELDLMNTLIQGKVVFTSKQQRNEEK